MGPRVMIHQKTHRLRHRSSELFLFQDQETMTACLNQKLKKKKSYFWIKSILNMLKFAYNYFSQIPFWKYQEYI